jgi:hypothetical protein
VLDGESQARVYQLQCSQKFARKLYVLAAM